MGLQQFRQLARHLYPGQIRSLAYMMLVAFSLSFLSCQALFQGYDPRLAQDYFTSTSRKVVKERQRRIVEYAVGDIYENKKVMFYEPNIWESAFIQDSKPYGLKYITIPVGTKFEITAVKADLGINGSVVEPYFKIDGLSGMWFAMSGFEAREYPKGYNEGIGRIKHTYDRENFRRNSCGKGIP